MAALGGGILQHDVLALALDRVPPARGHLPLDELDELADAVGRVHDVVPRRELQGIDDVAAARGELLHDAVVAADGAPVEVALGEDRELRLSEEEPRLECRDGRDRDSRFGDLRHRVRGAGGQTALRQNVARSVDEA